MNQPALPLFEKPKIEKGARRFFFTKIRDNKTGKEVFSRQILVSYMNHKVPERNYFLNNPENFYAFLFRIKKKRGGVLLFNEQKIKSNLFPGEERTVFQVIMMER